MFPELLSPTGKKNFLAILLTFYTPNKPENQNFEKI